MSGSEISNIPCYILLILTIFSSISYPISSLLTNNATISSFGVITYFPRPLHVEGRYIKDDFDNIIILKGVNKVQFEDYVGGVWLGQIGFRETNVKAELDAMKKWGVNVIRSHMCVKWWVDNPIDPYSGKTHRQIIKDLVTWLGERGMYFIFEPAYILDYFTAKETGGGDETAGVEHLPYPPWLKTPGAEAYINSEQDLVNYWISVVNELKHLPNILFELWNEPGGGVTDPPTNDKGQTPIESWAEVAQWLIDKIRKAGADQPIIIQWDYGPWYNFEYGGGKGWPTQWVPKLNLSDPLENLVYSVHLYRHAGAYGVADDKRWSYEDVKTALTAEGLLWVVETLNKPLFVGEIGCNLAQTGEELEHEIEAFTNALKILNEWGANYAAYWWRPSGRLRLIENWEGTPTVSGQILIEAIGSQKP